MKYRNRCGILQGCAFILGRFATLHLCKSPCLLSWVMKRCVQGMECMCVNFFPTFWHLQYIHWRNNFKQLIVIRRNRLWSCNYGSHPHKYSGTFTHLRDFYELVYKLSVLFHDLRHSANCNNSVTLSAAIMSARYT